LRKRPGLLICICEERDLTGCEEYKRNKINLQTLIFNRYITKNNLTFMVVVTSWERRPFIGEGVRSEREVTLQDVDVFGGEWVV